jgi:hypothetical protein
MLDAEHEAIGEIYHNSGKLVCHPDGRPVHADTITDRFNRLVDQAGVKRIRLHDVRHTYATVSLDSGVDPKIVADRIGHANMAYTLQIYTHRSTGRDRQAAEAVANLIFGGGVVSLPSEPISEISPRLIEDSSNREQDSGKQKVSGKPIHAS